MKDTPPNKKYILFSAMFTAAGLLALLLPLPLWAALPLASAYFLGHGYAVGKRVMPEQDAFWRTFLGTVLALAFTMAGGAALYFVFRLDTLGTALLLLAVPAALHLPGLYGEPPKIGLTGQEDDRDEDMRNDMPAGFVYRAVGAVLALALLGLAAYGTGLLDASVTDLPVRTPWDSVPRIFFVTVFLLALGSAALAAGRMAGPFSLVPMAGLAFLVTTVAVRVYSVGFGFDPFIHQATEAHILEHGQMLPKPPYYLGQYALVTVLARLVGGHLAAIDSYLVPVAFALTLPVAYWSLRRSFGLPRSASAGATMALLALPLSSFVMTTPQGLANALLLMTACLTMAHVAAKAVPGWFPLAMAAAAAAVHPLAGVPLFLFVLSALYLAAYEGPLRRLPGPARWVGFAKLVLLTSIALPAMFLLNSRLSGTGVTVDAETVKTPASIIGELKGSEVATRQFSAILDFVYSWRAWRSMAFVLAGLAGLALLLKTAWSERRPELRRTALAFAAGALAFLVNFVVLRVWVDFPFLIEYERTSYADRMAELALFLAVPVGLYALARLLARVRRSGFPTMALTLMILLAAVVTSSAYLAYPRRDRYESSRGWSTSGYDVRAVREIEDDADGTVYAVLANQSVSAGAIRELGFRTYFEPKDGETTEPVFFYPIPTGGPLYSLFLEMNDSGGPRSTASQAMTLTGADTVYYVVNHYWWDAQKITVQAAREADDWWTIDDKIWVFRYDR